MIQEKIDIPDIDLYEGVIPAGYNFIIYEKEESPENGYFLYGFDEVGRFDSEFTNPAYAFVR